MLLSVELFSGILDLRRDCDVDYCYVFDDFGVFEWNRYVIVCFFIVLLWILLGYGFDCGVIKFFWLFGL